jgi:hypothetical protein
VFTTGKPKAPPHGYHQHDAKGIGESEGMAISGPKTNSSHKGYGIEGNNRKRTMLDQMEGD